MYDRQTESFWSQARGEGVVGHYTDTKLTILPMQLLTIKEVRLKYPKAQVLSADTGYARDYTFYPYGGYDQNEELVFPVSVSDRRFPAKEIMYVIPVGEQSLAFVASRLNTGVERSFEISGQKIAVKRSGGEIVASDVSGKQFPGYFEMWFSWATHHQKNGVVWQID